MIVTSSAPQSCKNMWVLLSGSSILKSKEFIGTLLKQNAPQLVQGLKYHKSLNANLDVKELWSKEADSARIPSDFIEKLSRLLSMDPLDAYQLFLAYLQYDYKGTPKSIRGLFVNERSIQSLLLQLYDFYRRERLFSLFCSKQILSQWHEDSQLHPYQALFDGFLMAVNENHSVFHSLLDQFEECVNARLPSRTENGPYITDQLINVWIRQNLREIFELCQNMLLYLEHIEPDLAVLQRLLSVFQGNTFFTRYQFAKQVAALSDMLKYERLIRLISFTQSIIIVRAFRVDLVLGEHFHYLLLSKETAVTNINKLNEIILSKCNSLEPYAPVLLGWLVMRSKGGIAQADHEHLEYLGNAAFRLKVFDFMNTNLTFLELEQMLDSRFASVLKMTVGQMLSGFFAQFDLDILRHKQMLLYEICTRLLDESSLVAQMLTKREDCGLFTVFSKAFSNFGYNMQPVLDLCASLSRCSDGQLLFRALADLPYFTEHHDPNSKYINSTQQLGVYQLNVQRRIFGDSQLIIEAGTLGMMKESSPNASEDRSTIAIEWHDVKLDGLRLLCYAYKDRMDKLLCQTGYSSNTLFTNELSIMNTIFARLLQAQPDHSLLQSIPAQVFHSFRLFTKVQKVPRLYIASTLRFYYSLIQSDSKYETSIWDVINESGFFPYMIGLVKDRQEISCGRDTNASKIGEIIMFEECIEGHYDLCCAYLDLLSISFPSNESAACSLLVHVLSEIFPSFQQWHFRRTNEHKQIAYRCLNIFQKVLSLPKTDILPDLCRIALLTGQAGETLLGIIVRGESLVREIIEGTGCSNVLKNDQLLIMVRHSLSVLNRLLILQEKKNSDSFKKSSVEQALFSTQSSKPNMILVLTHYVFQRYDPRLATLAVTLLKRLSKHFPMSLLACLGSDAESVRDHFLYRLEEVTEDLMLKIALLDFLSCCIKHQPGLIEMFLNLEHTEDGVESTEKQTHPPTHNCLKIVLDILEERLKMESEPETSKLHSAAIKFIFTFWIQPHLLAIDSLKKTNNLWQLICFPLLREQAQTDEKLFGNILKILARELFYIRTLEKPIESSLQQIFQQLCQPHRLLRLSEYISVHCYQQNGSIHYLLSGWRDFLVSISKFKPVELDANTLKQLFNHLLCNLVRQMEQLQEPFNRSYDLSSDHQLLQILSECCVVILRKHGSNTVVDDRFQFQQQTSSILYAVSEKKDRLTLGFLVSIQSFLSLALKAFKDGDLTLREPLKHWYTPWCELFKFVYQVLEKNVQDISDIDLRLANSTLGLFHCLVNLTQDIDITWLSVIRNQLILESMVNLLCYLVENHSNFQLIETILHTFILLSTVPSLAHLLQIMRIIDKISTSIGTTLSKPEAESVRIFELMLQLASSLLITTKHHFVDTTIGLLKTHQSAFVRCLRLVRETPYHEYVREANHIVGLLTAVTPYKEIWITLDASGYEILFSEVLKTTHSLIAYLIRPNLLQYSLKNRANLSTRLLIRNADVNVNDKSVDKNVSRVISFDLDLSNQLDSQIHQSMFKLLLQNLMFLNQVTPTLQQALVVKEHAEPSLETVFTAPNIDADKIASFGSLLYCISLVIRLLNKYEKNVESFEPNSVQQFTNKEQLTSILETSLTLLLSQALLAQSCNDLSERDKQTIRRDLKTELGSMLLPKSRHSKRNLNTSLNSSIHKSPESSIISNNYIKFLMDQLEDLFKN